MRMSTSGITGVGLATVLLAGLVAGTSGEARADDAGLSSPASPAAVTVAAGPAAVQGLPSEGALQRTLPSVLKTPTGGTLTGQAGTFYLDDGFCGKDQPQMPVAAGYAYEIKSSEPIVYSRAVGFTSAAAAKGYLKQLVRNAACGTYNGEFDASKTIQRKHGPGLTFTIYTTDDAPFRMREVTYEHYLRFVQVKNTVAMFWIQQDRPVTAKDRKFADKQILRIQARLRALTKS